MRLSAVEINSSFYRPHRPATYARWAASVPPGFRFAVKMPREISHVRRLVGAGEVVRRFLCEVRELGEKLGPLLLQLPPSLSFDRRAAGLFFEDLRAAFGGDVVCEPRDASWFEGEADALLTASQIARVAADPAPAASAGEPGGWRGLAYLRLHGAPEMYYSPYEDWILDALARRLDTMVADRRWCIFDNTARGEATQNAVSLLTKLLKE